MNEKSLTLIQTGLDLDQLSRHEPVVATMLYDHVAEMPLREGGDWVRFADVQELNEQAIRLGQLGQHIDLDKLIDECRQAVPYWEPLKPFIEAYDTLLAGPASLADDQQPARAMVQYEHAKGGATFKQYADDPLPPWASNVRPYVEHTPTYQCAAATSAQVPRELLQRCLSAMKQAVTFGETGRGRPPAQTCMFEIEELESLLAAVPNTSTTAPATATGNTKESKNG